MTGKSNKDPLEKLFTVLVLIDKYNSNNNNFRENPKDEDPFVSKKLFRPDGPGSQTVVEIRGADISLITSRTAKIDGIRIIDDHKKRQMLRFR